MTRRVPIHIRPDEIKTGDEFITTDDGEFIVYREVEAEPFLIYIESHNVDEMAETIADIDNVPGVLAVQANRMPD